MKQFLAVEKLKDEDGNKAWYRLVFSSHNERTAQGFVDNYRELVNPKTKLCGELV